MSLSRGGTGGTIVNVSSAGATLGSPHEYVHYAAAKMAVNTLTVGLAKELADQGIRVNAVAPGLVDTEIHAGAGDPDRPARFVSRVPLGRGAQADEIAPAIAWLFTPAAGYVTGAVIRVAWRPVSASVFTITSRSPAMARLASESFQGGTEHGRRRRARPHHSRRFGLETSSSRFSTASSDAAKAPLTNRPADQLLRRRLGIVGNDLSVNGFTGRRLFRPRPAAPA